MDPPRTRRAHRLCSPDGWPLELKVRCLRPRDVAQWTECLSRMHRAPYSIPGIPRITGIGVQACNPSPWEVQAGGSEVQSHPQVHRQFVVSLDMREREKKRRRRAKEIVCSGKTPIFCALRVPQVVVLNLGVVTHTPLQRLPETIRKHRFFFKNMIHRSSKMIAMK